MTLFTAPAPSRSSTFDWVPAFCGIAVICMESTNTMGAGHTAIWLGQLFHMLGQPGSMVELLNHYLRKGGHFTGYGLLGVLLARGWYSILRRRGVVSWRGLRLRAAACGVASTMMIASADEIHQMFLPTRGPSFYDVLLDTGGALTLNAIFFAILMLRRRSGVRPVTNPLTVLGLPRIARPLVQWTRRNTNGTSLPKLRARLNPAARALNA